MKGRVLALVVLLSAVAGAHGTTTAAPGNDNNYCQGKNSASCGASYGCGWDGAGCQLCSSHKTGDACNAISTCTWTAGYPSGTCGPKSGTTTAAPGNSNNYQQQQGNQQQQTGTAPTTAAAANSAGGSADSAEVTALLRTALCELKALKGKVNGGSSADYDAAMAECKKAQGTYQWDSCPGNSTNSTGGS